MRKPLPAEEYATIIDNKGRERVQRVEYIVRDVRGEEVYVTADGLAYAEDSLEAKDFYYLIGEFGRIPTVLSHPDIVNASHLKCGTSRPVSDVASSACGHVECNKRGGEERL